MVIKPGFWKPTKTTYLVNATGDGAIRFRVGGRTPADDVLVAFLENVGYHVATREEYHKAVRRAKEADGSPEQKGE